MARPILIASRDSTLQQLRSRLLRDAGYTTIRIDDIALACSMVRFGAIGTVLVDWTFTADQQAALIYSLKQMVCRVHVICLRKNFSDARMLLDQCARCESEHVGGCVHFLQGAAVSSEKKAETEIEPDLPISA